MNAQKFVDNCSDILFKGQNKEFILNRVFIAKRNIPAFKDVSYKVYIKHGKKVDLAFNYEDTIKMTTPTATQDVDDIFINKFLQVLLSNSKIYETIKV